MPTAAVAKIYAYKEDVASLSTETPQSIGTSAAAGDGSGASKDDHVHDLGAGVVDDSTIELTTGALNVKAGGITANELAADSVTSAKIDTLDGALNCGGQELQSALVHQSSGAPTGIKPGQEWQDTSGDVHVCITAAIP